MCSSSSSMSASAEIVRSRKHAAIARGENFESLGSLKQLKHWSRFAYRFCAGEVMSLWLEPWAWGNSDRWALRSRRAGITSVTLEHLGVISKGEEQISECS